MNERIKQLQIKVNELTAFIKQNSDVQIPHPLGNRTRVLIQKGVVIATGDTATPPVFNTALEVSINGKLYWLSSDEI